MLKIKILLNFIKFVVPEKVLKCATCQHRKPHALGEQASWSVMWAAFYYRCTRHYNIDYG